MTLDFAKPADEGRPIEDSTDALINVAVQHFPTLFDHEISSGDRIFMEIAQHNDIKGYELSAPHVFMVIKYHLKTICAMCKFILEKNTQ